MNVLSIGNSFSQDAQTYLHHIAKADGVVLNCFNLYIGGCPLSLHHKNMLSDERAYLLEMNGKSTGFKVSLKEALLNRSWDVVTLQQASHESPDYSKYQPYLNNLAQYVRLCVPKAKIVIHQTWAYEDNSARLNELLGYTNHIDMYNDVAAAYKKAAEDINADFTIPSGTLFEELLNSGFEKVHRDTFHASYGAGRYALGLLWYVFLTGNGIDTNQFSDFTEEVNDIDVKITKPVTDTEIAIVKGCVKKLFSNKLI